MKLGDKICQACIKLSIPPPGGGGGIKSKGLEMGKKIKSLKKRKKKNFEDLTLLVVPKVNKQLLQHNLTLFKPNIYCLNVFYSFEGKKIKDFVTRRGEENQRQGGE